MALPTLIASAKGNVRSVLTTGITITHGFTLADGDVLEFIYSQGDNNGTAAASSSGGTWAQLVFVTASSGDDRILAGLRRVVTNAAGEPATYTFTMNSAASANQAGILLQIRGANTTTPEDVTATSSSGDNDFTPANVAITTITNDCLVIIAHHASLPDGVSAGKTAGAPSGWTLIDVERYTAGADLFEVFLEVASLDVPTLGTVTPGAWTGTANDATAEWATIAIAIRPLASAGAFSLILNAGSYAITGKASGIVSAKILNAVTGVYSIVGKAAGLFKSFILSLVTGNYVIDGKATSLISIRHLNAATGSYILSGKAAGTVKQIVLNAIAGSYVLDGKSATLKLDRVLLASKGIYDITGLAAVFEYIPVSTDYEINAESGVYLITGKAAKALLELDDFPAGGGSGSFVMILND